jgi:hypothetical protein
MKKIFLIALALVSGICSAQTFKVQNLDVLGTSTLTGLASFTVRPQFNGATPWDSGNLNPSSFLTTSVAAATYAPIASPTFTGTVIIPAGASIAGFAHIASPTFTGVPAAPTAALGTNTTQLATTAFIAKHTLCPSVLDYGGDPTGASDNSTALTNALAAAPAGRACAYFGPGKWKFTSGFVYNFPNSTASITIQGEGPDITELTWPNGSGGIGIVFQGPYNTAHVRNMSLTTGTTNGGDAINMVCPACNIPNPANTAFSDVTNVLVRGADGYEVTDYWSIGVNVLSVSNINFTNFFAVGPAAVAGQGISLEGTSIALGVAYNVASSAFNALSVGLNYGTWVQGVTVNQSNFTADSNGILASPGIDGLDQLYVGGSQFNCFSNGILIQSPMNAMMFTGNFFLVQNNGSGIFLQNVAQFSMYGNTFNPAVPSPINETGIVVGPWFAQAGVIVGNQFTGLNLALNIQNTAQNVNLQSNSYSNNTTNLVNACAAGCTIGGGSQ